MNAQDKKMHDLLKNVKSLYKSYFTQIDDDATYMMLQVASTHLAILIALLLEKDKQVPFIDYCRERMIEASSNMYDQLKSIKEKRKCDEQNAK